MYKFRRIIYRNTLITYKSTIYCIRIYQSTLTKIVHDVSGWASFVRQHTGTENKNGRHLAGNILKFIFSNVCFHLSVTEISYE